MHMQGAIQQEPRQAAGQSLAASPAGVQEGSIATMAAPVGKEGEELLVGGDRSFLIEIT
jgi:hypothetical protein